jgi:hypothetical protein
MKMGAQRRLVSKMKRSGSTFQKFISPQGEINEGTQLPSAASPTDDTAHNESPVLSRYRLACESAG